MAITLTAIETSETIALAAVEKAYIKTEPMPLKESEPKKAVNFYDFDGTILYSYTKEEALELTAMPDNVRHPGLVVQGWNYPLQYLRQMVRVYDRCDVSQTFVTDVEGETRLYCHFEKGRLSPRLGICPNGTVSIDWGDDSDETVLTGSSLTTLVTTDHTYAEEGEYTIKLTCTSGSFAITGDAGGSYLFKNRTTVTGGAQKVYTCALKRAELGTKVSLGAYAFASCHNMTSITIPNTIDSLPDHAFYRCYSLRHMGIPSSVTTLGTYSLHSCDALESISIPRNVTVIPAHFANGCINLRRVCIPNRVTTIGEQAFYGCQAIPYYNVPASVTYIYKNAFSSCYGLGEAHFHTVVPPTLETTAIFTGIQADAVIYVPSEAVTAYKTGVHWGTYSSYIQGE